MSLKLGSNDTAILAGSSVVKQMLLGSSPKFAAPVLDHVPNAAAAYSLRRLSNAYTGPVVKVRRSSDSTTADFTAAEVVDGTLTAWVGAGDGFVHTWYDQSGNARNATQATAASQPKVVSSGVVVTEGGKAALSFDGVDDHFAQTTIGTVFVNKVSVFCAATKTVDINGRIVCFAGTVNPGWNLIVTVGGKGYRFQSGYNVLQTAATPENYAAPDKNILVGIGSIQDDIARIVVNGVAYETNTDQGNGDWVPKTLYIGAQGEPSVSQFFTGTISEVLIYPSDVSASRELAEGEMAWHYGLQSKLPYNHAYAPQALGGASQTVPTDSDVLAFAAASGAKSIPDLNKIEDLVTYLKAQGLWNYARFYPMKSAQNAGTGSTVYGLGGLTSNNMTLVNSPTWGSGGVTFDGSTQYGTASIAAVLAANELLYIRRNIASQESLADTTRVAPYSLGDVSVNGMNGCGATALTAGEKITWAFANTIGGGPRFGSSLFTWEASEDFIVAHQMGDSQKVWKNKVEQTMDKVNGMTAATDCGPTDLGLNDSTYVEGGAKVSGTIVGSGYPQTVIVASLIIAGSVQPTTTQRETITDLINAL